MNEIIDRCLINGHFLSVKGEHLKVENAANLDANLKEKLIENKKTIIEALQRDTEAKKNGLLIGITGTLYTWTVSRRSTAYLEFINGEWVAWRETYDKKQTTAVSTKVIARASTFSYAMSELKDYMNYITKSKKLKGDKTNDIQTMDIAICK